MNTSDLAGSVSLDLEQKGTFCFDYDFSLLSAPSSVYSHDLARLSCAMIMAGYDIITEDPEAEARTGFPYTQKGLEHMLDLMGFTAAEINPKAARDQESYYLAFRQIVLDGKYYDLFVSASIGSYNKTWYSNFDPMGAQRVCEGGRGYAGDKEKGAIHLGFADARDYVRMKTRGFVLKHRTGNPVKLLIIGHSRGAATAGLLAAKVISEGGLGDDIGIDPDDVFTYCVATPNYADTGKVNVREERFARIFNINSPEDFVTGVFPKACGFGRYGTVYVLFGRDNLSRSDYAKEKAEMARFFSSYRPARPYSPYKDGNRSVDRIIRVMAEGMTDLDVFYNKKYRLCFKSCTPYEYFRDTLCSFVSGNESPEDAKKIARAQKLLLLSAADPVGTSRVFRKLSEFFVFKQGLAGATGGRIGKEYFNDAHVTETYLAYLMSMSEDQLIKEQ